MIILNIAHREFVLPDLAAAQTLLDIFSKSQEIESRYHPESGKDYYRVSDRTEIKISIVNNIVKTEQEYKEIFEVQS